MRSFIMDCELLGGAICAVMFQLQTADMCPFK